MSALDVVLLIVGGMWAGLMVARPWGYARSALHWHVLAGLAAVVALLAMFTRPLIAVWWSVLTLTCLYAGRQARLYAERLDAERLARLDRVRPDRLAHDMARAKGTTDWLHERQIDEYEASDEPNVSHERQVDEWHPYEASDELNVSRCDLCGEERRLHP